MACGTQVVSTDCPTGPREILEDGKWGSLVPVDDVGAMCEAMLDSLKAPARFDVARRAQDFSVDRAVDAYLSLLLPDFPQDTNSAADRHSLAGEYESSANTMNRAARQCQPQ
jgi:hypothetical protein